MKNPGEIEAIGALLGRRARAAMVCELLDGRTRTATELADIAAVSRSTASWYLGRLADGGLLKLGGQGRHRYFRLSGPGLAAMLESVLVRSGTLAGNDANVELTRDGVRQLSGFGIVIAQLRRQRRYFARACLDWSERRPHLAAALGSAIAVRMFDLEWIQREPDGRALTIRPAGRAGLRQV